MVNKQARVILLTVNDVIHTISVWYDMEQASIKTCAI